MSFPSIRISLSPNLSFPHMSSTIRWLYSRLCKSNYLHFNKLLLNNSSVYSITQWWVVTLIKYKKCHYNETEPCWLSSNVHHLNIWHLFWKWYRKFESSPLTKYIDILCMMKNYTVHDVSVIYQPSAIGRNAWPLQAFDKRLGFETQVLNISLLSALHYCLNNPHSWAHINCTT